MSAWQDLAAQFRALGGALELARLEREWSDSSEEWRMAGRFDMNAINGFNALAQAGGDALAAAPAGLPPEVAGETDSARRWYRALWYLGGPHDPPVVGLRSLHGRSPGTVYVGRIRRPADVSAALATRFADDPAR